MQVIDVVISKLFSERWVGEASSNLEVAKKQLAKNLRDQLSGYWSGHTAYSIMVDGGFLIDSKPGTEKNLTAIGKMFMDEMNA